MLEEMKEQVWQANQELSRRKLALFTWGNASGWDASRELMVIKPSGVPYDRLQPSQMSVVDKNGRIIEGLKPSSDTPTHLTLYRAWGEVGGIAHTHSRYATIWAQACRAIPCFGTTHADYFYGEVPCTDCMTPEEVNGDYESSTGDCIVRAMQGKNPLHTPGVLVANHAPFAWGRDVDEAIFHASVLEEVAQMASETLALNPDASPIAAHLAEKHYQRKHGPNAYYGQTPKDEQP